MGSAIKYLSPTERAEIAHSILSVTSEDEGKGELHCLCIYHEDENPSASYNYNKDAFNCFACGAGTDLIGIWSKVKGFDQKQGYKAFCKQYRKSGESKEKKSASVRKAKEQSQSSQDLEAIWEKMEPLPEKWKSSLMETRGWSRAVIEKYDLRLQTYYQDNKSGFLKKIRKPERVAIPIRDAKGRIRNIRLYKPGAVRMKIISWGKGYGASRLFPAQPASISGPVILCEGEQDTLCALSHGFNAITQTSKTKKWKPDHIEPFRGREVIIAYDADQPGQKYAEHAAENLVGIAESIRLLVWPDYMGKQTDGNWPDGHGQDLTDFFIKHKKTAGDLEKLFSEAVRFRDQIKRHIAELNKKHAVVMIGGRCVVMNEIVDPTFNRPDVTFSSVNDFRNYYANQKIPTPVTGKGKSKEISIATDWMNSIKRRQYEGIVFSPGKKVHGYYNLYRGLSCKPKKGDWSLFRDHVLNIIASGDKSLFKWVTAWLSRICQDPGGRRPGTSIVLRGKQGSGKGCFVSQIGAIFGSHFLHITSQKQLTGRFNNHLKDALIVFCDEATWGGDRTAEGILKGIVTEKHIMVEPKGKDAFAVMNHINLIVASNNNWVIPAGLEERRFCVIDVSEDRLQDRRYFKEIFEQMDNGGREAMLYDLLKWDISSIDLRTIPRTKGLFDQILSSMNTVQKFWFERLSDGTIPPQADEWSEYAKTHNLYKSYIGFANTIGDRYNLSPTQFTKELKKLSPGIVRRRLSSGNPRPWALYFPPLYVCREQFEQSVRMEINWKHNDDDPPF